MLEFVASALRCAGPTFPDTGITGPLRDLFDAGWAGACDIDLRGEASHSWADTPHLYPVGSLKFHQVAIGHPLTLAYRRSRTHSALRLSDHADPRKLASIYSQFGDVLTVPLVVAPQRIVGLALGASSRYFPLRQLTLARQLHPILAEIYSLQKRAVLPSAGERKTSAPFRDQGIPLTSRELAVLDLMANGLIAHAIANQLAISARTVSKHIESIYRKLDTHDRTSAVMRGQTLGLLPSPPR
ncbi:LuxR C-terminal-related transcriptional regulator [Nonomuraea sp. NPDC049141]|uniref:helix-turn-helix transcriptional regulator n=1 Tax=Nonomuraea sp. NPDC049141 TaxID=3155500 RepID=UPI00340F84D0